jgi:hypothetical protein
VIPPDHRGLQCSRGACSPFRLRDVCAGENREQARGLHHGPSRDRRAGQPKIHQTFLLTKRDDALSSSSQATVW